MRTKIGASVLLRRHLAADRGGGGDGLHGADPGAPDVAPVRKPVEEGEPEGFAGRPDRPLSEHRGAGLGRLPHPAPGFARAPTGRLARRSRARVGPDQSARRSSARGRGRAGFAALTGQSGSVAGAWAHSPCRVQDHCGPGLPSTHETSLKFRVPLPDRTHPAAISFGDRVMARIAGVNLPAQKHVWVGLQSIYGIGRTRSKKVCDAAGVDVRPPRSATCPSRKSSACAPKSASTWSRATCAAKSAWPSSA